MESFSISTLEVLLSVGVMAFVYQTLGNPALSSHVAVRSRACQDVVSGAVHFFVGATRSIRREGKREEGERATLLKPSITNRGGGHKKITEEENGGGVVRPFVRQCVTSSQNQWKEIDGWMDGGINGGTNGGRL